MAEAPLNPYYAAEVVGRLWAALRIAGGPWSCTQKYQYFPELFDPAWLQELPLPLGDDCPPSQTVALTEAMHFFRAASGAALAQAYSERPRTRVYEGIDARTGGWTAWATRYLMALAECRVACSMYESSAIDATLGPHQDDWYGLIVQMSGAKAWWLGQDAEAPQPKRPTVTTFAGDVLLVPQGLLHHVGTPKDSVHLSFALIAEEPGDDHRKSS